MKRVLCLLMYLLVLGHTAVPHDHHSHCARHELETVGDHHDDHQFPHNESCQLEDTYLNIEFNNDVAVDFFPAGAPCELYFHSPADAGKELLHAPLDDVPLPVTLYGSRVLRGPPQA